MKKRYRQGQREEIVEQFRNSEAPKGVFAKGIGIGVSTLNKWIVENEKDESPKFIKVSVPKTNTNSGSLKIQFEGFEIIVEENTSEELLWMALRGVKSVC